MYVPLLMQVLEQISPKQADVACMTALENPDRNRAKDYLPCEPYMHHEELETYFCDISQPTSIE